MTGISGYEDGDIKQKRIKYTPPPLANPGNVIKIGGMTAGAKDDMPHASHGGRSGEVLPDGSIRRRDGTIYTGPEAPNPGNVLKVAVGGGKMGSKIAHENEAPFPEALVEPFVKCFCPPDGIVCDPMMGSGTTLAVAHKCGRGAVGMDIRPSQVLLTARRLKSIGAL
jgi:hypothetical protein